MNRRIGCWLAGLALGAVLTGAAQAEESAAAKAWWPGFLAGARLVTLPDGRRMNLYCEGKGGPVVVMDAGLGDGATTWRTVQDQIATRVRVCVYDQAGIGRSTPGPEPRDSVAIAGDMAAMLKAAGEKGPYVLVGHSAGSFNVRLFAFTHPKDVAGMVLVDPSADRQVDRMAAVAGKMPQLMAQGNAIMKPCTQDPRPESLAKICSRMLPASAPPEAAAAGVQAQGPDFYRTLMGEMDAFIKLDSDELEKARQALGKGPALGDRPLIVLTAGETRQPGLTPEETAAIRAVWITMHDELAALSRRGVNRIVPGTTHYIHQDKPQAVVDTVFEVTDAARAARR